jgi:hypothetical protein
MDSEINSYIHYSFAGFVFQKPVPIILMTYIYSAAICGSAPIPMTLVYIQKTTFLPPPSITI